ncbi:hypothetical protein WA158_003147 [Blastocystis sp. Blastoise]
MDTKTLSHQNRSKNVWAASLSNLMSGYNLNIINIVVIILGELYGPEVVNTETKGILSASSLIGCVLGQLLFGFIGDWVGRKTGLLICNILNIVGCIGCALSFSIGSFSFIWFILLWRIILGLGNGGVYPLSAVISAESADSGKKESVGAFVYCINGVGWMISPMIAWILLEIFPDNNSREYVWRGLCLIGALPCIAVLCIQSTETGIKMKNAQKEDRPSLFTLLRQKENIPRLLGTGGSWFIFDINCYGQAIFATTVVECIFHSTNDSILEAKSLTLFNGIALIGSIAAIPFIKYMGLKVTQVQGFICRSILFFICAIFINSIENNPMLLVTIYSATFFWSNFGPGTTTFLLPAAVFPAEIRATMNGFAAALGKVGAALGAYGYEALIHNGGKESTVMYISGSLAFAACILTIIFINKNIDIEAKENRKKLCHSYVHDDDTITEDLVDKNLSIHDGITIIVEQQ